MSVSRLSRGSLFSSYLNRHIRQSSFVSRHLLQAVAPTYNFYGSNNCNIYGREFRTEHWSFISVRENNRGHLRSCNLERSSFSINLQRSYASQASPEQKSNKMLLCLTGLVFAMVGCSYAAVPLYRRFCQATGYGGTVQRRESVEEKIVRHAKEGTLTSREIILQFNADVADGMPWKFVPTQREVRVKPGESALAFYTAENRSSTPITGVSTYNVTPMKAAVYFDKIQCFCFEEQRLLPGEQIDMPVFFYIDPEFETDPRMDGINNLILSYTFFKRRWLSVHPSQPMAYITTPFSSASSPVVGVRLSCKTAQRRWLSVHPSQPMAYITTPFSSASSPVVGVSGFIVFITNIGSCFIFFITNLATLEVVSSSSLPILEGLLEMTRLAWKGIQWLENSSKEFALAINIVYSVKELQVLKFEEGYNMFKKTKSTIGKHDDVSSLLRSS
ncbi:unnamed protein product [Fraxinus pennsylvanica]|uniref:Cytochrome c oxidase assembly protein n=1 Tax=Fraxinus pennsylvanica TaxID=56036 RepID=A0AAD2DG87_9LAMI|nr:unnamed protein product [Fraxinus pennsylvanica]